MLIVHDGKNIPTLDPKDANDVDWFGFEYLLNDGESITSSAWMIDAVDVVDGQTVSGLMFVTAQYAGNITKAQLSGGMQGTPYLVSNRISLSTGAVRERSFYLPVTSL